MKLRTRAFAAVAAIALLFTQLAVSAFACPGESAPEFTSTSQMDSMPGCHESDAAPSPLCPAHCTQAAQSLDKPPVPDVAPAVLIGDAAWRTADDVFASTPIAARASRLIPPAEPPPAIRNCCLRI